MTLATACWPDRPGLDGAADSAGRSLTESARQAMAVIEAIAPANVYPAGVELQRQGEVAVGAFFITAGLVKLHRGCPDGRGMAIGLRAAGWPLGAAAVILGQPYAATVTTIVPTTALHVSAPALRGLLRARPEVSEYLLAVQSQEVQEAAVLLADIACTPARDRLERLLADLSVAAGRHSPNGEFRFQVPLRRWELAQLVNVTPQYLSGLMAVLERDRVLRRHKGWLVLNPGAPRPRAAAARVAAGGRGA